MIAKPISLILVYIIFICNLVILILPFMAAIFPFTQIHGDEVFFTKYISFNPKAALYFLFFVISFLMMCYLFLDFIFGFSVKSALRLCRPSNQNARYGSLEQTFEEVKQKFSNRSAKLYIQDSEEINAFAVGGMGNKAVVLTAGLIKHYDDKTENEQECLILLRSILGHEMSHLVNKDFLPGLLIIINQKVTNLLSGIFLFLLRLAMSFTIVLFISGNTIPGVISLIYNTFCWFLNLFNKIFIVKVFNFLRNFFGRAIEYRCDQQSAKAFGGYNMAYALSLLGKSGYFTLFSSHPATQRRIKKVEKVQQINSTVRVSIISRLSNFVSMLILPSTCFYMAHLSKTDLIIRYFIYDNFPKFYFGVLKLFAAIELIIVGLRH